MAELNNWTEYYKNTTAKPPKPILIEALKHVAYKGTAIDIGAGALNETRYLLEQGFEVTVLDVTPQVEEQAKGLQNDKVRAFSAAFEDFNFGENEYDLACAMYSLPFTHPKHFDEVFAKVKKSLKPGGIFCGQLFGVNDTWANNPQRTFHTKDQVEALLKDMKVISLKEVEKDEPTAAGTMKHWHVFHIIAQK